MSANTQQQNKEKKDVGGLWKKTSKAGSEYMSGSVEINGEKVSIVVFSNSYKKPGEKTPDFKIFISEMKENVANETVNNKPEVKAVKSSEPQQKPESDLMDDEIPF